MATLATLADDIEIGVTRQGADPRIRFSLVPMVKLDILWGSLGMREHFRRGSYSAVMVGDEVQEDINPRQNKHLSHSSNSIDALKIFNQLWEHGLYPDEYTFSAVLPVSADLKGVVNENVFDAMSERSLASWKAMIAGFCRVSYMIGRLGFSRRFLVGLGLIQSVLIFARFSLVLSDSADISCVEFGKQVHAVVVKLKQFSKVYVRNLMITGWLQNDNFEQTCYYFWMMRRGLGPDEGSLSTAFGAAATIAALNQGTLVHNQILKIGFVTNRCVANSLTTMYAKCGSLIDAQKVFEERECPNVVSWTALMAAYLHHGYGDQVHGTSHASLAVADEIWTAFSSNPYAPFLLITTGILYGINKEEDWLPEAHSHVHPLTPGISDLSSLESNHGVEKLIMQLDEVGLSHTNLDTSFCFTCCLILMLVALSSISLEKPLLRFEVGEVRKASCGVVCSGVASCVSANTGKPQILQTKA
ncbi:Pentatricopeptide repeat [Dillenia turbinata]|uniref:Pentatricopeptide repeat n=1 Tax=Dillenia turbinata TaxID=194707 RepID=A0AAN8YUL8_9MAGN